MVALIVGIGGLGIIFSNYNRTKALSQKNRRHAKLNADPHHLGSRGYLRKQDSWSRDKDQCIMPEIHNMYSKAGT
ncbi:hypothetical protein L6452_08254 [Arctium lappa]|uniref:Uncharacterized protein n=1 Tax=Arctium lappa TaxID=4217 RepID=A0ACB9DH87_ARCLA|nr:hypothetical protein L6452_08254 [Arctium lappa]